MYVLLIYLAKLIEYVPPISGKEVRLLPAHSTPLLEKMLAGKRGWYVGSIEDLISAANCTA